MIRTQIYLPDDLYHQLKQIAVNSNLNFSQLIRQGAQKVVSDHSTTFNKEEWLKNFIGRGKTPVKTSAVEDIHDYYRNFQ